MDKELIEKIESGIGFMPVMMIQRCVNVFAFLSSSGVTVDDMNAYLEFRMKNRKRNPGVSRIKTCDVCGSNMAIVPIHEPEGQKNRYGYKSFFTCLNENCTNEIFNDETPETILRKLGEGEDQ